MLVSDQMGGSHATATGSSGANGRRSGSRPPRCFLRVGLAFRLEQRGVSGVREAPQKGAQLGAVRPRQVSAKELAAPLIFDRYGLRALLSEATDFSVDFRGRWRLLRA